MNAQESPKPAVFACTVSGSAFLKAATFASQDPTRYYLAGVYIEPSPKGGAVLVATDGHGMVIAHDPGATVTGSAIVSLPAALMSACKAKRGNDPQVTIEGGFATVGDLTAPNVIVDGSFPDWRRVVPDIADNEPPPASGACFDAFLINRMGNALCGGDKTSPLSFTGKDTSSPHLVYGRDRLAFGVLMPIRMGSDPFARDFY
jgi:hypothetical protein